MNEREKNVDVCVCEFVFVYTFAVYMSVICSVSAIWVVAVFVGYDVIHGLFGTSELVGI